MWILLLTLIIGLGLTNLISKNVGILFKFLIAPALGLFVFTYLAIIISFTAGINQNSIIFALFISFVISLVALVKFKKNLTFNNGGMANFPLVFVGLSLLIVIFLAYIWFTQALSARDGVMMTGGGGMYGDSALHAAYTSRLQTGQFPLQNPLFAGRLLVYPLANDFLSAILKIAGLDFNLAFSLPQILFLIGFLTLFYLVTRKLTSDLGFAIAITILFLGWGIGWVFFLNEWKNSGITFWQFLGKDYTENSQYNLYLHNILTGLILPERSFLPGLFLGLLIYLNFWEYLQERKLRFLLISGIILGALPFWHTHTFIFFAITSLIFGVWLVMRGWGKRVIRDFGMMYLITLIMALPFLFLFFTNHEVASFIHWSFGWQNGVENILVFWFKNSILTMPLAILGMELIDKEKRFLFIPAFVIFVIANLVIFQPWDWDNIKLLSWSFLFFAILAGAFLAKLATKGKVALFFVVFIILASSASGSLSILLQLKNKYVIYDQQDIDLANWAKTNTNVDDIFIIEAIPNHPIPGLAGRLVYLGYPGHLWVHGISYNQRELHNNRILSGDFSEIDSLKIPIKYIAITKGKLTFDIPSNFKVVFQNKKYSVFSYR